MSLGFKIKRLRELQNLTQEYLAVEIGISQRAYSKLEAGKTKITIDRLRQISTVLKIPASDLLDKNAEEIMIQYLSS